jgi:uncharacterized membrane protein
VIKFVSYLRQVGGFRKKEGKKKVHTFVHISIINIVVCLFGGVERHFQPFGYIVAVSFIGGGNR